MEGVSASVPGPLDEDGPPAPGGDGGGGEGEDAGDRMIVSALPFTIVTAEQRSPAWRAARLGRLTGSRAADMLAQIKSGEAAGRRDYRLQLVCERLTGESQEDSYVSKEMQRGIDLEASAFAAYEAATGELARKTGFLGHPEL